MALTKEDRIAFSKQIVFADIAKASVLNAKAQIEKEKDKAYDLDQGNKRLVDPKTYLIDGYHVELGRYTGSTRTFLTEAEILDSANFVLGNLLFPNDAINPPPSTAPLVWTKTNPYARNKAVGKQYNETYPTAIAAEQSKTTDILNLINQIQANYTLIQRVTGQICTNGTCSLPQYLDSGSCTLNGGVWTPGFDTIITYPAVQTDHDTLESYVLDLKSYLQATQALILTDDPDAARQAQNNIAIADIPVIIAALDAWLAVTDFNTAHGEGSCAGFNSHNPASLGATRLQSGNLSALETALQTREAYIATRVSEIETNLGDVVQNLSNGSTTGTGLYFERWQFLLLRLNLLGGSLILYTGYQRAMDAQDEQNTQTDLAKAIYSTLLTTTILSAPTNGTKTVHLKSAAGFVVGDNVFIVSDTQEEVVRTIESIDGNRVVLGKELPPKYRPNESARIYKDIS